MKSYFISLFTAFIVVSATGQEINFEQGSWTQIKAKAKEQGKIIFLDAYTTWCGPCKAMAKKTFTNAEVASFYNANFINAKIDMEKGEGPALEKEFDVNCYPNLLFIDGNGNIVHRAAGYIEAPEFLQLGKNTLIPEKTFSYIKKQYNENPTGAEFAKNYFMMLANSCMSANDEAVNYLNSIGQDRLTATENWEIIQNYIQDAASAPFKYLIKNKEAFAVKFTQEAVEKKIFNTYLAHSKKLINQQKFDSTAFIALKDEIKNSGTKRAEELLLLIDFSFAEAFEDWNLYYKTSQSMIANFKKDDAMFLNNVSWAIFEHSNDKNQLAEAEGWAKRSTELQEEAFSLDTYANLLFKNGKKQEAINVEKRAIEKVKAEGEDASDYEETLSKFEGKK